MVFDPECLLSLPALFPRKRGGRESRGATCGHRPGTPGPADRFQGVVRQGQPDLGGQRAGGRPRGGSGSSTSIRATTGFPFSRTSMRGPQASEVVVVCDVLQIPALARRDLLLLRRRRGRAVKCGKKGQFSPEEAHVTPPKAARGRSGRRIGRPSADHVRLQQPGGRHALLRHHEGRLPAIFDAERARAGDGWSGGQREFVAPLARRPGGRGGRPSSSRPIPILQRHQRRAQHGSTWGAAPVG